MSLIDALLGAGGSAINSAGSMLGLGGTITNSGAAPASTPYTQGGDPMAYLMQGLPGYTPSAAAAPQTPSTLDPTYTQGGDPMAYLTQGLPGYTPSRAIPPGSPSATGEDDSAPVTVNAPNYGNAGARAGIARNAKDYNLDTNGAGTGLANMIPDAVPGAGTLRNLLGTLGDAFLIQSGHEPAYAAQRYRQQIAQASAGFTQNPEAAVDRIAATGAPGAMTDAVNLNNATENRRIREAQIQSNTDFRNDRLSMEKQATDAKTAQEYAATEAATRSRMSAILSAGVNSRDPQKWAAAKAAAAQLGSKYIKDFKPDIELPDTPEQYNPGMGQTAVQYDRGVQRGQIADQNHRDRRAAINAGITNTNNRVSATNGAYWQSLTDAEDAATNGTGPPLTDGQKADLAKFRHTGNGKGGAVLPPSLQPKAPGGGPATAAPRPTGGNAPAPANGPPAGKYLATHNYPDGTKAGYDPVKKTWVKI